MKQMGEAVAPSDSYQGIVNAQKNSARSILGVPVEVLSRDQAVQSVIADIKLGRHEKYAFLNAHGANIAHRDVNFRDVLNQFTVLSDGIGVDLASKILYGQPFPANLNGTDFIPALLSQLDAGTHVALLGAQDGVAEIAIEKLKKSYPNLGFSFAHDGFFDVVEEQRILDRLAQNKPDILLVAFGNPKQEKWIWENITGNEATAVFGVGALFDFIAERVPRAPQLLISLRLEWLYRLALEPGRMWRRYIVGNPAFLIRVLKQKVFGAKSDAK